MNKAEQREYYRNTAERWIQGVRLQLQRCLSERADEVFFDSNFLVVAVARLSEVARMACKTLGQVKLSLALKCFDNAHPDFRDVRDYQEHVLNPSLIGSAVYSPRGGLFQLYANGDVKTLIDPHRLAESAEALYHSICEVLGPLPSPKDTWVIRPPNKRRRKNRRQHEG